MRTIEIKKNELTKFAKELKQHSVNMDKLMKTPESYNRGKSIAKEMNDYEYKLDMFLHFQLGIDLKILGSVLDKTFKI